MNKVCEHTNKQKKTNTQTHLYTNICLHTQLTFRHTSDKRYSHKNHLVYCTHTVNSVSFLHTVHEHTQIFLMCLNKYNIHIYFTCIYAPNYTQKYTELTLTVRLYTPRHTRCPCWYYVFTGCFQGNGHNPLCEIN